MEVRLHSSTEASLESLSNVDGDGDGNENGEKSNRFRLAKKQLYTCTMLFVHFLALTARLRRENA